MGRLVRTLVLFVVLLLGALGGARLSWSLATVLLEPAERSLSNAPSVAAEVLLVLGLAFIARKVTGTAGLVVFVLAALLGAAFVGWKILRTYRIFQARTSQSPLKAKFAEQPFHALR